MDAKHADGDRLPFCPLLNDAIRPAWPTVCEPRRAISVFCAHLLTSALDAFLCRDLAGPAMRARNVSLAKNFVASCEDFQGQQYRVTRSRMFGASREAHNSVSVMVLSSANWTIVWKVCGLVTGLPFAAASAGALSGAVMLGSRPRLLRVARNDTARKHPSKLDHRLDCLHESRFCPRKGPRHLLQGNRDHPMSRSTLDGLGGP